MLSAFRRSSGGEADGLVERAVVVRFIIRLVEKIAIALAASAAVGAVSAADDIGAMATADAVPLAALTRITPNMSLPPKVDSSRTTRFSETLARINQAADSDVEGNDDAFARLFDAIYAFSDTVHARTATVSFNASASAAITDVAGSLRLGDVRASGFEVLAGVRSFDTTLDFQYSMAHPATGQGETRAFENLYDFVIGARYTFDLSDHWAITLRGDGGFGETDSNYNTTAALKYHRGNGTWLIGYQYMDTRFNSGGRMVDLTTLGPVVGYTFSF